MKDRILASFPELQAFKDGQDILLTSNKVIGTALQQVCKNDVDIDAYILALAARIVRRTPQSSLMVPFLQTVKLKVCLNSCKL